MVADSRAKMSKFVSGVNNSVVNEYSSTMLNSDITLAWLMTHAQQIEEQMIKMRERQNKRARAELSIRKLSKVIPCSNLMGHSSLSSQSPFKIHTADVMYKGKSTLAKTAYNFNFNKYDGSSFLADVNKTSERHDGLVCLQRQLLSNVLGKKAENIYNVDNGVIKIQEAIQCRIILLVLDDVDDSDHLNAVLGMREEGMTPLEMVLIDEAAQLKECESTIPLQLLGLRHAILIGDEKQFPAMVQRKICKKAEFGRILLDRLVILGHKKHLFNVQY
ncbi:hypothetical protein T459_04024 [Capsicum annuum]|uniref:DNA2/NAM7 helicase helicase domain-containing protein n=1 Tax=Capsicum annuum TaxID=4072 RepID=A0A2G3APH8_CAPAN|nr:hypothetical protein T459_04024 [Capsicum annuum]